MLMQKFFLLPFFLPRFHFLQTARLLLLSACWFHVGCQALTLFVRSGGCCGMCYRRKNNSFGWRISSCGPCANALFVFLPAPHADCCNSQVSVRRDSIACNAESDIRFCDVCLEKRTHLHTYSIAIIETSI